MVGAMEVCDRVLRHNHYLLENDRRPHDPPQRCQLPEKTWGPLADVAEMLLPERSCSVT